MKYTTDQDGKSKTASAVDQEQPEAEAQRNAAKESHNVTNSMKRKGGSVQHE